MSQLFKTTWTALVKVSSVEVKPFYYIDLANTYQLFLFLGGVTFYAELDKKVADAKTFDLTYKTNAIQLN